MDNPIMLRLMSCTGLIVMFLIAWVISENRRMVPWRILLWGIALQLILGIIVLRSWVGHAFFSGVRQAFDLLTAASSEGARFLFGNLSRFFLIENVMAPGADGALVKEELFPISAVIAFNVLPVIIFVSGIAAVLQHLGIIQAAVRGMAWLMRRTLKTSGAETFVTALLVFIGIESVSTVGSYLKTMTRSELFTIMTAFLATIAASVMVAYAGFGAEPGHLLAASVMSAPAAIAIAKLMIPETGKPETASGGRFEMTVESENVFDAASRGAGVGLNMALNVGAMLIVFVGIIYLLDRGTIAVTGTSATVLISYLFRPFAFIMGVPMKDVAPFAELLATKTVINEFIAYQQMQGLITEGVISKRTITIATYALCGFANPGSLGILIGGMAAIAPERRSDIARMSLRALVAGTLAAFTTACIAGILTPE